MQERWQDERRSWFGPGIREVFYEKVGNGAREGKGSWCSKQRQQLESILRKGQEHQILFSRNWTSAVRWIPGTPWSPPRAKPIFLSFLRYLMVISRLGVFLVHWGLRNGFLLHLEWSAKFFTVIWSWLVSPTSSFPTFPWAQYNSVTVDFFLSAPQKFKAFHVWAFAFAV